MILEQRLCHLYILVVNLNVHTWTLAFNFDIISDVLFQLFVNLSFIWHGV